MPSPMENRAIVFGPSRRPLEKTGSDRVTLSSLDRDFRLPVRPTPGRGGRRPAPHLSTFLAAPFLHSLLPGTPSLGPSSAPERV